MKEKTTKTVNSIKTNYSINKNNNNTTTNSQCVTDALSLHEAKQILVHPQSVGASVHNQEPQAPGVGSIDAGTLGKEDLINFSKILFLPFHSYTITS